MAKKAVIQTGSKQYVVQEGDTVAVELIRDAGKTVSLDTLLVIDGDSVSVGAPLVDKIKVTAAAVDTYGAWREGQHDDLVRALAMPVRFRE